MTPLAIIVGAVIIASAIRAGPRREPRYGHPPKAGKGARVPPVRVSVSADPSRKN